MKKTLVVISADESYEEIDKTESMFEVKPKKNWRLALALSIIFGLWGLDRLYLGRFWHAVLKFMTLGGVCIWWIYDIYVIATKSGDMAEIDWR